MKMVTMPAPRYISNEEMDSYRKEMGKAAFSALEKGRGVKKYIRVGRGKRSGKGITQ